MGSVHTEREERNTLMSTEPFTPSDAARVTARDAARKCVPYLFFSSGNASSNALVRRE